LAQEIAPMDQASEHQQVTRPAVAAFPETPTSRVRAHRRRAAGDGLVRVEVTVPEGMAGPIRFAARLLRDGSMGAKIRLLRFLLIMREAHERAGKVSLPRRGR
jgi:hypothetical protein